MVIDTSALVSLLCAEAEAGAFAAALEADPVRLISAATVLESALVLEARFGAEGGRELDLLISTAGLSVEPITADHVSLAREAWRRFGKGRHPAGLNFGDCFSYALAKATGEPLLFKGADFAQTDITAVAC